ncbi:MAG: hypothetical protein U9N59_07155 [Campylobacterota bacterium]|nr:hypothetical protein [Campylobacterota bacterium]
MTKIFVELSNSYISVNINDNFSYIDFEPNEDGFDDKFLDLCVKSIEKELEKVEDEYKLVLLLNSSEFIVKTTHFHKEDTELNTYFSEKILCDEDELNVKKIKENSYLLVKDAFLQKMLFKFKDIKIESIYDSSILNSLNLLKSVNALYIDISYHSFDISLYGVNFQKRSLNNLFYKFIKTASDNLHIDFNSGCENFKSNFSKINTYDELLRCSKPAKDELKSFVDEVVLNIKESLSFFSTNEKMEFINKIYINGDILEYDFLVDILNDALEADIVSATNAIKLNNNKKTNITIAKENQELLDSLKIELDGLSFRDGKKEFVFIDNGFHEKKKLTKKEKIQLNSTQRVNLKKEIDSKKITNRKNSKKNEKKSILKMDTSELVEFFSAKFKSFSKDKDEVKEIKETDSDDEKNKMIFLGVLFLGGFLYYFINFILDEEKRFDSATNSLEGKISQVKQLRNDSIKKDDVYIDERLDKIFWTRKLMTIANNMPNAIWLSSIQLVDNTKEIDGQTVIEKTMVLEGRSLPSSIGHIENIAMYMDKLLKADINFKRDFIDVTFQGATTIDEYGYKVINFKLHCNFEKNKHIEEFDKAKAKQKEVKKKSITENLADIGNQQNKKIDTLNNIGKK